MIHTIHIDDSTLRDKQIIKELKKEKNVRFDNQSETDIAPEGYMSVEDFRTEAKASAKQIIKMTP